MGGFATKKFGTIPIPKDKVPSIVLTFANMAEIPIKDLHFVGSIGLKDITNDIDIAVDSKLYPMDKVHDLLSLVLGPKAILFPGLHVGSYAIPFKDEQYQVDLIFTPNIEWAEFSYFSPLPGTSLYKGAVRNILFGAIVSHYNYPGETYFQYLDEKLIFRAGWTFDLSLGLRRIYQYRPIKNDVYLNSLKTISNEEFRKMIPNVPLINEITNNVENIIDPIQVVHKICGYDINIEDIDTAEQILEIIKCFPKNDQQIILNHAADKARSVVNKIDLPEEILSLL